MSVIIIEKATENDNSGICRLCEIPMAGFISLVMERAPDYFVGAKIQNQQVAVYVCKKVADNSVVGLFSIGRRNVFINGTPTWVYYFSDLRIHPDFQKSMLLIRMCKFIREHEIVEENGLGHTVVFSENKIMTDLIARGNDELLKKLSLPKYSIQGKYCSYMISLSKRRKKRTSNLLIRKAQLNDVNKMQKFFNMEAKKKQWYPCYEFSKLTDDYYQDIHIEDFYLAFNGDNLVGITGTWDQKNFKQTKVFSYSPMLKKLRPAINALSAITGGFKLPPEGGKLNYFTLHSIVTKNNEMGIFCDLVNQIYWDNYGKSFDYFLCGLDNEDSLNKAFDNFKTKKIIRGNFYLMSFNIDSQPFNPSSKAYYLEASRI